MDKIVLYNPKKNRFVRATVNGQKVNITITSPNGANIAKTMSLSEWKMYLKEKKENGFEEIKEGMIEQKINEHPLVTFFRERSRQFIDNFIKVNFVPSAESIQEAERLIYLLVSAKSLAEFNDLLEKIFALIPRKMKNPILYLAKSMDPDEMREIIEREESIIKGLSSLSAPSDSFCIKDCPETEKGRIMFMLDPDTKKMCTNVYKIEDPRESSYRKYCKENDIRRSTLLFHGSRTENWFSILATGLKINPTNVVITGKMFGHGIYFANKAKKSVGYTSLANSRWANGNEKTAYLAVYEVATGDEEIVERYTGDLGSLTKEKFEKLFPGKNSLHAVAGTSLVNDEIIVYDENACVARYLIEIQK